MERQQTSEGRAGRNAAPIVAAEAHHVFSEFVESRKVIVGHSDQTVPFRFESDVADLREEFFERPLRPGSVDRGTGPSQGTHAPEHKAAGTVETKRTQDVIGVPGPLPFGKNGRADVV